MEKRATHPNGMTVVFDEQNHTYTVKETGQVLVSATTFIDRFFPKFDMDRMAPRCVGKPKYSSMTADEIKASWEANAQRARDEGTNVHEYAQYLWDRIRPPQPISERCHLLYQQVDAATKNLKDCNWSYVAAEKIIFSPELGIAGTIDLLLFNTSKVGEFLILDWKQNGTISTSNKWETAKPPIGHLEATDLLKYSLQLNLYRFILRYEGYYPLARDIRMALVHLREDSNRPIKVHLMDEIFQLLAVRKRETQNNERDR
jgi:hypothetical protein